jgi:hypothetical protein
MKTAREILKKYEDEHVYECDRKWIIKAMEEYATQFKNESKDEKRDEGDGI